MTDLATLELGTSTVVLRQAEVGDIPAIVDLLSTDQLGVTRRGSAPPRLRAGTADNRQVTARCTPVLPAARIRGLP